MSRIIIIGAGISGPILATFLKLKGYDPVVYERHDAVKDAGLFLTSTAFVLSAHIL
jgi:salicylate hydroxylase